MASTQVNDLYDVMNIIQKKIFLIPDLIIKLEMFRKALHNARALEGKKKKNKNFNVFENALFQECILIKDDLIIEGERLKGSDEIIGLFMIYYARLNSSCKIPVSFVYHPFRISHPVYMCSEKKIIEVDYKTSIGNIKVWNLLNCDYNLFYGLIRSYLYLVTVFGIIFNCDLVCDLECVNYCSTIVILNDKRIRPWSITDSYIVTCLAAHYDDDGISNCQHDISDSFVRSMCSLCSMPWYDLHIYRNITREKKYLFNISYSDYLKCIDNDRGVEFKNLMLKVAWDDVNNIKRYNRKGQGYSVVVRGSYWYIVRSVSGNVLRLVEPRGDVCVDLDTDDVFDADLGHGYVTNWIRHKNLNLLSPRYDWPFKFFLSTNFNNDLTLSELKDLVQDKFYQYTKCDVSVIGSIMPKYENGIVKPGFIKNYKLIVSDLEHNIVLNYFEEFCATINNPCFSGFTLYLNERVFGFPATDVRRLYNIIIQYNKKYQFKRVTGSDGDCDLEFGKAIAKELDGTPVHCHLKKIMVKETLYTTNELRLMLRVNSVLISKKVLVKWLHYYTSEEQWLHKSINGHGGFIGWWCH